MGGKKEYGNTKVKIKTSVDKTLLRKDIIIYEG